MLAVWLAAGVMVAGVAHGQEPCFVALPDIDAFQGDDHFYFLVGAGSGFDVSATFDWGNGRVETKQVTGTNRVEFHNVYSAVGAFPVSFSASGTKGFDLGGNPIPCSDSYSRTVNVALAPCMIQDPVLEQSGALTGRAFSNGPYPNRPGLDIDLTLTWGDGTPGQPLTVSPGGTASWMHDYAAAGTYELRVSGTGMVENSPQFQVPCQSGNLLVARYTAGGGGPPTSGEIPDGFVTWLRGDVESITFVDGHVDRWASRGSGVPAVARPGLTGERPRHFPTGINGLGAVHFDGTEDRLELAFDVSPASMPTVTVFAAFQSDTASASPLRKLWGHDDGGFDRTVGIDDRGPASCNYGFFAGDAFADYFGLEASTTYVTADVFTPTEFRGRVNGDFAVQRAASNGPGLPTTFIGASGSVFAEFWLGPIAEFIVYGRELSAEEIATVESYLMTRYAVTADPVECGVAPPGPQPFDPGVSRIDGGGTGRVEDIAVDACQVLIPAPDTARAVLLARNDVFADALAGAPLAGNDSCVLFTPGGPSAPLDPATRAEIDRVLASGGLVRVLGGTNAVSEAASGELASAGYTIERFAGGSRFETATLIAGRVRSGGTAFAGALTAIVAYAGNWPDAVTAGAFGAVNGIPILLTDTATLHPATAAFLQSDGTGRTIVAGGPGVISDAVFAQLPNPERVAGSNRMATAIAVTQQLWGGSTDRKYVVVNIEREDGWTIALAAAPLSAREFAPQLGVGNDRYPDETRSYLVSQGFPELPAIVLIGNAAFISDTVATQIGDDIGAR